MSGSVDHKNRMYTKPGQQQENRSKPVKNQETAGSDGFGGLTDFFFFSGFVIDMFPFTRISV